MGVNSLWDILSPTARPVRLEALTRKRLAVDASIWIYQFMKAVRDSEGNTLPQSHIVGFFRRICKLLYFGIQPVFVFDGGAPALKRKTIQKRRERREGGKLDATETAHRLLAMQVQKKHHDINEETTYLDDLPTQLPGSQKTASGSPKPKKRFNPRDEYHLPELKKIRISQEDERLIPEEEFKELTLELFDIVDGIDINTVDPNSKAFSEFPLPTQYMILSHLRLKSRLRMGYSKEQLEDIFDDSMDFSKFQIQQVQKRNFYTQRLMDLSGMGDEGNATRRIAGEKDRKYALIRTDDGWTLSLEGRGTDEKKPIDLTGKEVIDIDDSNPETRRPSRKLSKPTTFKKPILKPAPSGTKPIEVSDSEDDFEDVDIPEGEEETPEEKEFNKAVIASIYEGYKNDNDAVANGVSYSNEDHQLKQAIERSVTESEEDRELKLAIQESKAEFNKLQQKEHEMERSENNFDFGESLLFLGDSKEVSDQNPAENEQPVVEETDDLDKPIVVTIEPTGQDPKSEALDKESKNLKTLSTMKIEQEPKAPVTAKEEELKKLEALMESDEEETSSKTKPQTLPSWFNGNVDSNIHTQYVTEEVGEPEEGEDLGLISWDKAREYLEESSDDEVQEISGPQTGRVQESNLPVDNEVKSSDPENARDEVVNVTSEPSTPTLLEAAAPKDVNHKDAGEQVFESNIGTSEEDKEAVNKDTSEKTNGPILDYVFVDDEDEIADKQLREEEQDHEKLKKKINEEHIPMNFTTSITEEQLLQEKLLKQRREAEEVTQTMINDVQELLRRFGIPFITAPMEAEAQCVELLKLQLVDGIVTDDSDSFLFGGDRVYKNMFNQKQFVECYLQEDFKGKLSLDQDRFIEIGLLLGSDYTEGIKGIGPVLAVEILAEFGDLKNFKQWYDDVVLKRITEPTSSVTKSLMNRVKSQKLFLPPLFPDSVVFDAYKNPEVDHSKDAFKWGTPDLDQIRSFLMLNVGWSQGRVDEVMVPLIRDLNRKLREGTQSTIGEFFTTSHIQSTKELNIGKRMKAATNRLRKSK